MAADRFEALLRVNRLLQEDAMRDLGRCVAAETEANTHLARIERAIEEEMRAATCPDASDLVVETFGHWLRGALVRRDAARAARDRAEADIVRARAVLGAARAARAALENEQERRRERLRVLRLGREQAELDEHRRGGKTD